MPAQILPGRPVEPPADTQEDLHSLVIETSRLILRQPARDDAPVLAALANDVAIAENLSTMPHPYSVEDAVAYIDNTAVTPLRVNYGIYAKDRDGAFVGTVSLQPRDGERYAIGYWVGRPYWGTGFATEAAQALVDLAFDRLAAPSVAGSCRVTNSASRRVLEKCGFPYAGQGMGPSLFFRGMVPVDRFRLERPVWKSLRAWRAASVERRAGSVHGIPALVEAE